MSTARRPARRAEPPPELSEPATRVLRRFRLVFNTVRTHFRSVEKQAGIAGAQVWALSVIRDQPGIGVSALARAMDIHQSTASNLLKPLMERGLVLADRASGDRRAVRLQLSAQGLRVLRKAPGPLSGVLPDVLMQLDERTLARLDRDLAKVVALLGRTETQAARLPLGRADG